MAVVKIIFCRRHPKAVIHFRQGYFHKINISVPAMPFQIFVRVLPSRYNDDPCFNPFLRKDSECAERRFLPGRVPVIGDIYMVRIPLNQARLILRERRTKGRDALRDSIGKKRDHIHIPFH